MTYIDDSYGIKRAFEDVAASSNDEEIVAAVVGKRIVVLSVVAQCGATATDLTFLSNGTPCSMVFQNGANGGAVLGHNPHGWFETDVGEALQADTSAGSQTGVQITYALV